MIVGIAEIETAATGWPVYYALDPDVLREQMLFPGGEILFRNRKREVQCACGFVRRDRAAGRGNRFLPAPALENEEHLFVRNAEYTETFAGFKQPQSQLFLIEANRAGEIVGVETGFDDTVGARGGHDFFHSAEYEIS